jgi:DNA-damage-inducible protein J
MANTATIQVRIDQNTKQKAIKILNTLNIDMSEAIKMYLGQIILNKGIPFDLRIPNRQTAKGMVKTEAGKDLHEVKNINELFKELER